MTAVTDQDPTEHTDHTGDADARSEGSGNGRRPDGEAAREPAPSSGSDGSNGSDGAAGARDSRGSRGSGGASALPEGARATTRPKRAPPGPAVARTLATAGPGAGPGPGPGP